MENSFLIESPSDLFTVSEEPVAFDLLNDQAMISAAAPAELVQQFTYLRDSFTKKQN